MLQLIDPKVILSASHDSLGVAPNDAYNFLQNFFSFHISVDSFV